MRGLTDWLPVNAQNQAIYQYINYSLVLKQAITPEQDTLNMLSIVMIPFVAW